MTSITRDVLLPQPYFDRTGSGAPVLLLHGWAAPNLFGPIIAGLGNGYDCIAPHFPGFGNTPEPTDVWSLDDYARWTMQLMDMLSIERARVIGHSFGGRVAIRIAHTHPSRITQLVITGGAGIRDKQPLTDKARIKIYKGLRSLATSKSAPLPLRELAERQASRRGSADYKATSGVFRGTFVRVINDDQTSELCHVVAPTLLIWGELDETTPLRYGEVMEKLIPDAGLVVLAGGSHYAFLEQAPYFCTIVKSFFENGA